VIWIAVAPSLAPLVVVVAEDEFLWLEVDVAVMLFLRLKLLWKAASLSIANE